MTDRFTLIRLDAAAQARGGRPFAVRTAAAAVALAALFVAYANAFGVRDMLASPFAASRVVSQKEQAAFAERFAATVLLTQFGLVVVLVPALVSDCIARDRERGTLDLVLATDLSDAEIFWGRLIPRLLTPTYAVVALLPVLTLTQLFGGVSAGTLHTGSAIIATTLFGVGGMCGAISCYQRTTVSAFRLSAVVGGVYAVFGGAFLMAVMSSPETQQIHLLFVPFCLLGLPGVLALHHAPKCLRRFEEIGPPVVLNADGTYFIACNVPQISPEPPAVVPPEPVSGVPTAVEAERDRVVPPVDDEPLLWKERHFGGRLAQPDSLVTVTMFVGLLIVGILTCGFALPPLLGLIVFLRAVPTIVRERERDTLTALLMLPGGVVELLGAKWRTAVCFKVTLGLFLILTPVASLMVVGGNGAGYAVVMALSDALFLTTTGLAISAGCRTTRVANVVAGAAVVAMVAVPFLAGTVAEATLSPPLPHEVESGIVLATSPLTAWLSPFGDRGRWPEVRGRVVAVHVLGYGLATMALWRACLRWTASDGGRPTSP